MSMYLVASRVWIYTGNIEGSSDKTTLQHFSSSKMRSLCHLVSSNEYYHQVFMFGSGITSKQ